MREFHLDKTRCAKDGICKKVCPANIIRLDKEGWPHFTEDGGASCISCGQCIAFCPHQACYVDGLPLSEAISLDLSKLPTPEQTTALMLSRRSIRAFRKEEVSLEAIERIMDTVRFAPTAKNLQGIRWVVVNSRENLKPIGDLMADFMDKHGGPDGSVLASTWRKGVDVFFRGAPHLIAAVMDAGRMWGKSDAAIALTYFELLAHACSIGCCWGGYFTTVASQDPAIKRALGLADDENIYGAQMFGLPALRPHQAPPRSKADITWK